MTCRRLTFAVFALFLAVGMLPSHPVLAEAPAKAPFNYVPAKAWYIPPETTTEESGYFALNEGKNGKVYVGTAAYGRNAYLVEFDPKTQKMRVVVDAHKEIGLPLEPTGYAAQAKIHTRNYVGESGKIYIGTKQGYPTKEDEANNVQYPGGYVLIYDPATDKTENLGMPYPTQGVIDVVADESRGLIYVVTCEDQHWMVYDVKTKAYRELGPMLYPYATTIVDAKGRANSITNDWQIARFDPATNEVTLHDLMVDGKKVEGPGKRDSGWIATWNLAADGKTAYLVRLGFPQLWSVDLSSTGAGAVNATNLGNMTEAPNPDSRSALSIAPNGDVYVLVKVANKTGFGGGSLHHLIRYSPEKKSMSDLGVLKVTNPDFYGRPLKDGGAVDDEGKRISWTHGYHHLPDGSLTPLHAHMALIVASDGSVYITILYPYSLLKVDARWLKTAGLEALSD